MTRTPPPPMARAEDIAAEAAVALLRLADTAAGYGAPAALINAALVAGCTAAVEHINAHAAQASTRAPELSP